ncbi:hypothetical protein Vadar_017154 [Vaccinium darrowii]|uniref:Uncharacterized protein n=1 Tax=Vaccinium darrowii TaxID=229202 RepID=A0ACB7Z5W3_9ERIC|nr:hypothetical protein Vadar_017154 [Vaccinium darrowii]
MILGKLRGRWSFVREDKTEPVQSQLMGSSQQGAAIKGQEGHLKNKIFGSGPRLPGNKTRMALQTLTCIQEINDLPPNPNQPLPNPHLAPRAKPWEIGQTQNIASQVFQSQESYGVNSNLQDNGLVNQSNGDTSVPW